MFQIVYFMNEVAMEEGCARPESLVFSILQPIYVVLQLYIIFKYSNVGDMLKKFKSHKMSNDPYVPGDCE